MSMLWNLRLNNLSEKWHDLDKDAYKIDTNINCTFIKLSVILLFYKMQCACINVSGKQLLDYSEFAALRTLS